MRVAPGQAVTFMVLSSLTQLMQVYEKVKNLIVQYGIVATPAPYEE
jgi:hypothetical protein